MYPDRSMYPGARVPHLGTGCLKVCATATLGVGRALAAGTSEVLCVRTTMRATAPVVIGGQSVATVLTFTGSSV
jgi:hypothetical protein